MEYLLDTNICIHLFRGKFNLLNKLESIGLINCSISEISLAELVFGAEISSNPEKNHILIEKFTAQITILRNPETLKLETLKHLRMFQSSRVPEFES